MLYVVDVLVMAAINDSVDGLLSSHTTTVTTQQQLPQQDGLCKQEQPSVTQQDGIALADQPSEAVKQSNGTVSHCLMLRLVFPSLYTICHCQMLCFKLQFDLIFYMLCSGDNVESCSGESC